MEKKEWIVPKVNKIGIEDTKSGYWWAIWEHKAIWLERIIDYSPSGKWIFD